MREKDLNKCIWIHHIATFMGLFCGMWNFMREKAGGCRTFALVLYIESQIWAAFKIFVDFGNGGSRLKKSFERIQARCKDEHQEKKIVAVLVAGSVLFKLGVPYLLGKKPVR